MHKKNLGELGGIVAQDSRYSGGRFGALVGRAETLVKRRGLGYVRYLLTDVALPKLWYRLAYPAETADASPRAAFVRGGDRSLASLRDDARDADATTPTSSLGENPPPHPEPTTSGLDARGDSDADTVVARRGTDGKWRWMQGEPSPIALPTTPPHRGIAEAVVAREGGLWLRRTHRPRSESFIREAFALLHLGDFEGVPGSRIPDTTSGETFLQLTPGDSLARALRSAAPDERARLLRRVDLLFHRIHTCGITGFDVRAGRVMVTESGNPLVLGFDGARHDEDITTRRFAARRDADRVAFNRAHRASLLTETNARQALADARDRLTSYENYAPIDFGAGLTLGQIASTDSGTGRWEYFNGRVVAPLVRGRRVLDLGSNNGSMPSAMLRAGAREVTAVEMNGPLAALCELTVRIFEWRDLRPYAFKVHRGSMTDFVASDWGRFDVVTAFCSLYYLREAEMAAIVRKAASMRATLILQSNEAIDPGLRRVASAEYLAELMRGNGYANGHVTEYCPPGYTRVILVGKPPDGSSA